MPRGKLIAVVDDDESVRESVPDLLRSFGFHVEAYGSAEAFLRSGAANRIDCLLLDVLMPGMSGPELQQELARRSHKIPIVFITSNADETIAARTMDLGAAAYVYKPFSETAIVQAIEAALAKP